MTVEVVLILAGLWVLLGLIDAWVLHELGRSGWRLIALCAAAGPLSLSIVYDEVRPVDLDSTTGDMAELAEAAAADPSLDIDEVAMEPAEPCVWPADDPEGPFILQGYRGLSDH